MTVADATLFGLCCFACCRFVWLLSMMAALLFHWFIDWFARIHCRQKVTQE